MLYTLLAVINPRLKGGEVKLGAQCNGSMTLCRRIVPNHFEY